MKYKYLEHTSEAKFQAFGDSLEEAFANAGLAMVNIMTKVDEVIPKITKKFEVESRSKEALLFDFLDQILYIIDVDLMFPCEIEVSIDGNKLKAVLRGDNAKNCVKGGEVKAPTYDEMLIKENSEGFMVQVVVDV